MKYSVVIRYAKGNVKMMKYNPDNSILKYTFLRHSDAYNKKQIFLPESPYVSQSPDFTLCVLLKQDSARKGPGHTALLWEVS